MMTPDELQKENDILRGICAYENINCLYCGLSRAEMARCADGFPGCARADDMMCAPASIQEKYAPLAPKPTGRALGGIARAAALTPARRKEIAKQAARTRWDASAAGTALSKLGASKGGTARAAKLTPARRKEIAQQAIKTRWAKRKPTSS